MRDQMLSVVIPAWGEAENLRHLLPLLHEALRRQGMEYEIIVADTDSGDGTVEVCERNGVRRVVVADRGYGLALREGFTAARGEFILTMDADLSHPSGFIEKLWESRNDADLIIASRYIDGGRADMPLFRLVLSRVLNWWFGLALRLPVRDLSSGFRLYRRSVLEEVSPTGRDFNILQEILIRVYCRGYTVKEVPFSYRRRHSGSSHARLMAFAFQYLKTFGKMWRLRRQRWK